MAKITCVLFLHVHMYAERHLTCLARSLDKFFQHLKSNLV